MRAFFLVLFLLLVVPSPNSASACSCVPPPPPDSTHSLVPPAPLANENDVAFEGTVTAAHLKWDLLEAKEGDFISANLDGDPPRMQISFDISSVLSGTQMKKIEVNTGVGGGDCGYPFEVGKRYKVYATKDESGHFYTGICSHSSLVRESKADAGSIPPSSEVSEKTEPPTLQLASLCGRILSSDPETATEDRLLMIAVGNKSPVPTNEVELEADGSFCAANVEPDEYYLAYIGATEEGTISIGFFPGVTSFSDAKTISLQPGQKVENILLKIPFQPSYTVSGRVVAFDKTFARLQPKVSLLSTDYLQIGWTYAQDLAANGTFTFSRVLPGKYWAIVTVDSDDERKWFTTKVAVEVDNNISGLPLTLTQK